MSVGKYIKLAKKAFNDRKQSVSVRRIHAESERLREERQRQAELAKANAERARLQRDVHNIQGFNDKYPVPESKLQKIAKGLQKAQKGMKARSKPGSLKIGAPQAGGLSGFQTGGSFGFGSQSVNSGAFGGVKINSSAFGGKPAEKKKSPRAVKKVVTYFR